MACSAMPCAMPCLKPAVHHCFPSLRAARDLGMHMVYDVAHNIAKEEEHQLDGKRCGKGTCGRANGRCLKGVLRCACVQF